MNRIQLPTIMILFLFGLSWPLLSAPAADTGQKTLVFVSYPDPAEFLTAEILRRVGDAYEKENSDIRVKVETGLGYLASRELVLEGKATAMMISGMLNEPRAYQTQHSVSGAYAEHELKLDKFLPIAHRIIKSQDKTLTKMRLGLATDEISDELRSFLDFLRTDDAKEAIADLQHIKLVRPSESPKKIKKVHYKRESVTLRKPIMSY